MLRAIDVGPRYRPSDRIPDWYLYLGTGIMAIYHLTDDRLTEVPETSFGVAGIREREDLQRLLRSQIEVISPNTLVIAEEFGEWEDSRRRIDLLGIDNEANLVVIELKRTEDGGHMELQAIRYAAMVSTMTFDRAVEVYHDHLRKIGSDLEARSALLEFLDWDDPDEDEFAQDVHIVLVAADFSKELTTAVMWLSERDIDMRCIRMKPYRDGERLMLDVQQLIPLPEAEEYRVQIKVKQQRERQARKFNPDFTKYDVTVNGNTKERLPKRGAIFAVVRHLCELGHSPEEIGAAVPWKRNSMFRAVDGKVDVKEFLRNAEADAKSEGRSFEARRFYCAADELILANGKTYAFSNQWGSRTTEAIDLILAAFPDAEIEYSASS